jgi:putative chitinase
MLRLSTEQLRYAIGCTDAKATVYLPWFNQAADDFAIHTRERMAAFLAQLGHESLGLHYSREVWGPTAAQQRYEGRADLGNTQPGDGLRFLGRGPIQTTGRANYCTVRDRLRRRYGADVPDFERAPELLELPRWGVLASADYWQRTGCNELADAGDFEAITRRINGGLNGQADRLIRWRKAKQVLLIDEAGPAPAERTQIGNERTQIENAALPQVEKPMLPFVAAAIPALLEAAPALMRIFGSSPQAEKNAKAAEIVAEIAKKATGEPTVEGAVAAIQADPAKAAAYREAVHLSMSELVALAVQVSEAEDKSRDKALDRNLQLAQASGGRWLWLLGAVAVVVVLCSYVITAFVLFGPNVTLSDETKALLIGQIVIFGFATVLGFLFGSNIQNRVREERQRE